MSTSCRVFRHCFQGAALAALCFLQVNLYADSYQFDYGASAYNSCRIQNSYALCDANYDEFTGSISGSPVQDWGRFQAGGNIYNFPLSNGFFDPAHIEPGDYDEDGCFSAPAGPSGGLYCPGDQYYIDSDGYDSEGCTTAGICPDDPGWTDPDGYDVEGFDAGGVDRGGNTAAQGGGYWGAAGSGGTPPAYIDPPFPIDPANGNNLDGNGNPQCTFAYPVTASADLVPGTVLDGLAGCSNQCQYIPQDRWIDFNTSESLVQLVPTGYACSGSEPSLSSIDIISYLPPPGGSEPTDPLDNLNFCYVNGAYVYCDSFQDPEPPECYVHDGSWLGGQLTCAEAGIVPDASCGVFNGVYHCFAESNTNCASYNGSIQCVNEQGDPISQNSPDHPINGGNGDGNENNDVFADSQDVIDNGLGVQESQQQTLNAREVARQIDTELSDEFAQITSALSDMSVSVDLDETVQIGDGEEAVSDIAGHFEDSLNSVGTDPDMTFDDTMFDSIISPIENIFPAPASCDSFNFSIMPDYGMSFDIDTCRLAPIKIIAEWFIYGLTAWALFGIAIRPHQETT